MFTGRKLLYHRGVDDQVGTFVTDYVQSFVSACLAVILCGVIYKSKKNKSKYSINDGLLVKDSISYKTTYSVILALFLISMSTFMCGLVHQYLQTVEPYTSVSDVIGWLAVWRIAATFSGCFCFLIILLGQQILINEGLKMDKYKTYCFYGVLAIFSIIISGHSISMIFKNHDPWSLKSVFLIVYGSVLVQAIMILFAVYYRNNKINQGLINGKKIKNLHELSLDDKFKSTFHVFIQRMKLIKDLILHFLASFIFILAGALQFALGMIGCSDNDHVKENSCPLPRFFNHNALLHLLLTLSVVIYFIAEICAIKRREVYVKLQNDKFISPYEPNSLILNI